MVGVKLTTCLYSGCYNYLEKLFVRGTLDTVLGQNGGQRDHFVAIWSDNNNLFSVSKDKLDVMTLKTSCACVEGMVCNHTPRLARLTSVARGHSAGRASKT